MRVERRRSYRGGSASSMLLVVLLLLVVVVPSVYGSAVAAIPPKQPNPVVSLVGYVKDSAVRTINGVILLKTHHSRCNAIRAKLKVYRQQLQEQWENEGKTAGSSKKDIQKQLLRRMGGISYEEFCFLRRGKEDRGKLFNLIFISFGAPRFLPYALMFNPTMLPSTFQVPDTSHPLDNPLGWAHALTHGLLEMEASAATEPNLGIWSTIFRQRRKKLAQYSLLQSMAQATQSALQEGTPVADLLAKLPTPSSRKEERLAHWPSVVTQAVARTISGSSGGGLIAQLTPNFMTRSKLLTQLESIAAADDFLRETGAIPHQRTLLEAACRDRLLLLQQHPNTVMPIATLQEELKQWLDVTAHHPTHVGRLVVLLHNGCTAMRTTTATDSNNSMAHLLYQQQGNSPPKSAGEAVEETKKKGRRRKQKQRVKQ